MNETRVADKVDNDYNDVLPFAINNTEDDLEIFENKLSYTKDQKWSLSLMKLLEDINTPDVAFGTILSWACETSIDKYLFHSSGGLSKRNHIEELFNSIKNVKYLLPAVCPVPVIEGDDAGYYTDILCYDLVPQLLSILQNCNIMTEEKLLIDIADPRRPFQSSNNVRGEAISGSVSVQGCMQ
jgi:hypothetical protein